MQAKVKMVEMEQKQLAIIKSEQEKIKEDCEQ
jgi:hypothetical protein